MRQNKSLQNVVVLMMGIDDFIIKISKHETKHNKRMDGK